MISKAPEISVIVPVYNAEKFLPQCLDSILASSFKDIEVILVDDCGADDSKAICKEYTKKDKRVKLISNPHNMGVSAARNKGLSAAKGKYVSFVDSDDCIDATMYEKMHTAMVRENVDMVGCNAWSVESDGSKKIIRYLGVDKNVKTSFAELGNKIYKSAFHLWRLLIKRDMLQNIRFPEGISFAEDAAYLLQLYPTLQDIYFLAEPLYFYNQRIDSASAKRSAKHYSTLKIKDVVIESFNRNQVAENIREGFWTWYTNNLAHFYNSIPQEIQAEFMTEVQKMLPYKNYLFFRNRLEESIKKYYLFDFIPLLTVKKRDGKKYVKLFGKIPLYKVKDKSL